MKKISLIVGLFIAAFTVTFLSTTAAVAGSEHETKISLNLAQSHKLARANAMIEKVRDEYPNAKVAVRINGEMRVLKNNERIIDMLELSLASRMWVKYVEPVQIQLVEYSIQSMESVRFVLDDQLASAINLVSREMLGIELARKCARTC